MSDCMCLLISVVSSSPMSSQLVRYILSTKVIFRILIPFPVPLATLISATKPPKSSPNENAILSPDGFKRFFVVHGGLFSKDEVTLEDIRKIPRIGRQPGQEGLMCEVCCF